MKRLLVVVFSFITLIFCGCSVTQEMKENASFEGLFKVYVENPVGAEEIFSKTGNITDVNQTLRNAIIENLESKGFDSVENKADAQIIFRPLWNASYRQPEFAEIAPLQKTTQPLGIGSSTSSQLYLMLEIQAILPQSGDIWSWRGFSPELMSPMRATTASIVEQVRWCLEYFPPEKNPDRLSVIKKERKERKIQAEENPFKEVLIKDREKKQNL
ncbi:MAG: hypothetical protein E7036_06965 [Opitutales bacterium]|nr:hypothetical protein [Opitutales bacterium]